MPIPSSAHRMATYTAWADDVVLRNAERVSTAELEASRACLFGSIAGTFDHILVVAEIFLAHLEKRDSSHRSRRRNNPLAFAETARRLREIDRRYVQMSAAWSQNQLTETIKFTFVDGGDGAMTRENIIFHLANHATYHRGFVNTLLYPIQGDGRASDLTVFLQDIESSQSPSLDGAS